MSVLVKGMELPKSCPCELVGVGYDTLCTFAYGIPSRVREYYECCEKETRPNWCPILEVPPHGRLIDADAMNEKYGDWYTEEGTEEGFIGALKYLIAEQPIIIEEESKT